MITGSSLISLLGYASGISGLVYFLFTLKWQRRKIRAESDQVEIDNVRKLIDTWQETAEKFKQQAEDAESNQQKVMDKIDSLQKQVEKLTTLNRRIIKLLDKITHENMEKMVDQIKTELQTNETAS
jgi:esterase/lipase